MQPDLLIEEIRSNDGLPYPEKCQLLLEVVEDLQAEIARHHRDFDRWEDMAALESRRAEGWRTTTRDLVFQDFLHHHLPWQVVKDWLWAVIADDGFVVARCVDEDSARRIVAEATDINAQLQLAISHEVD